MALTKRVLSVLLLLGIFVGGTGDVSAAQSDAAVIFHADESDDGAFIDVTMSVHNAAFHVFQFALRFDPALVLPVDSAGQETADASQFLRVASGADWLTPAGLALDTRAGYLTFAAFVAPGQSGRSIVNAGGFAVCGADGTDVFRFRFRRVGAGVFGLTLATAGEGAFNSALPEGAALFGADGAASFALTFCGTDDTADVTMDFIPPPPHRTMTRDERLRNTILLPIGSAYAAVEGVRVPLYPAEPGVTAFVQDGCIFVPVRFVAEALGADVDWTGETGTVTLVTQTHTASLTVGEAEYFLNGTPRTMDAPAMFLRDRTAANARMMVPLHFIADTLGVHAQFDSAANMVILSPAAAPWDSAAATEQALMTDTLLMLSPLMQGIMN